VGINLFVHSVRLVLADWRNALKITGVLYLICAIPGVIVSILYPVPSNPEQFAAAAGNFAGPGIVSALLYLVAFLWMAVAWHRYVLLDEFPSGLLPEFNGSRMLSYFLYSLLIGIIGFAASFVIIAILGMFLAVAAGMIGFGLIIAIVSLAIMLIVSYRLGPILPATAVGKPITLGQAWTATNGANGAIIVLALVSAICAIVIDLPAALFSAAGPVGGFLALLWTLGTGWVKLIVGISILTTIYGHYVEGRAIPAAASA
jgi:hypothetical protein